ncbi:hypothetical protein BH10PLA2_BH10PLA2_32520 [soil metagenome]
MNREQLIQSIVARKLASPALNKTLCMAQKPLCFASAERAPRVTARLSN